MRGAERAPGASLLCQFRTAPHAAIHRAGQPVSRKPVRSDLSPWHRVGSEQTLKFKDHVCAVIEAKGPRVVKQTQS